MDVYSYINRYLVSPAWALKEGSPYLHHYGELLKSQYIHADQLRELQWKKLHSIITHAYNNSHFYRDRFDRIQIHPDDLHSLDDIVHLPILTKDDLRLRFNDIRCADPNDPQVHTKTTSGSTGVNVKVLLDEPSGQFKRACTLRSDEWSGWRLGEKVAAIWGNPEYKKSIRGHIRNLLLERRRYLDTLDMSESDMRHFAHAMISWKPSLLFGHAHSVYLFALAVKAEGISEIRPNGIITTAMVLHQQERDFIEDVFACKVTNRYGCEEVSLIACECEVHEGLHINAESVYVEFIKDGLPVQDSSPGSIIVTDLTNKAFPLIRYQIGDTGIPSFGECPCGRTLPRIASLEGRIADYVYTPEGKLISGISLTENFAGLLSGVGQLQIIQDKLDHIIFKLVKDPSFSDDTLTDLDRVFRKRFSYSMHYDIEYVDTIPMEKSGKYRFCISEIKNPLEAQNV